MNHERMNLLAVVRRHWCVLTTYTYLLLFMYVHIYIYYVYMYVILQTYYIIKKIYILK